MSFSNCLYPVYLYINAFNFCSSDINDQGLTRPKVLILLPFRECALRTVNMMVELLFPSGEVSRCGRHTHPIISGNSTCRDKLAIGKDFKKSSVRRIAFPQRQRNQVSSELPTTILCFSDIV